MPTPPIPPLSAPAAPERIADGLLPQLAWPMLRPSRTQLLGCFLLLGAVLCVLFFRYLRLLWWSR